MMTEVLFDYIKWVYLKKVCSINSVLHGCNQNRV